MMVEIAVAFFESVAPVAGRFVLSDIVFCFDFDFDMVEVVLWAEVPAVFVAVAVADKDKADLQQVLVEDVLACCFYFFRPRSLPLCALGIPIFP